MSAERPAYLLNDILNSTDISKLHIDEFSFFVCCPEYGWMDSRIKIGQDVFAICFSDVYPPFLQFRDWVLKIIKHEKTDPVWVDDEFNEHVFNVKETKRSDLLIFEYTRYSFPGYGLYRKALVYRKKLVTEFYLVLKYLMSIDFKEEGTTVWFNFDACSDEIINIELSEIESLLNTAEQ